MKRIYSLLIFVLIVLTAQSQTTVFSDDFDSGLSAWTLTGQWGASTGQAYNGTSSLADSPAGLYLNLQTTYATLTSSFSLSTALDANIHFRVKYDIENGFDYCYLDVSGNNGSTWTTVYTFNGEFNLANWSDFTANIGGFVGNSQVKMRFRMYTDPAYQSDGIFIDSLRIVSSSVDNAPPLIVHNPAPHFEGEADTNFRTATITDISGLDSVTLSYTVDNGLPITIFPYDTVGNDFTFAIPPQVAGAYVDYIIHAVDLSAQSNAATSSIYQYISGNYINHDNGVVSTVVNLTAGGLTSGAANRVSLGSGVSTLTTALIRNYTDVNNPNDSIEVHIWSNNSGAPGVDLINPITVFPEANLLEPQRMTRIDLRPYSAQLDSLTGDIYIGFIVPNGNAWICQTTGTNNRGMNFNGSAWTSNTTSTYHFRAITSNPENPPSTFFSYDNTNDPTIDFTDLSGNNPTSWAWSFGDGGTSTMQNPSHTYAAPGTYLVSLIATNNIGSQAHGEFVSVVNAAPQAQFTIDATGDPTIVITEFSSNNPTSWSWDFGDGGTDNVQAPTYTYSAAGTYDVCLIASNTIGSDTACLTTTIEKEMPYPFFSYSAGNTNIVDFTNLTSTGNPTQTTYLWDFDLNGQTSIVNNPTVSYPAAGGTFNVCLTATNAIGARDPFCSDVNLDNLTGILSLSNGGISISPNPTNGLVQVKASQSVIQKTKVFSSNGTQIDISATKSSNGFEFDFSQLSNGIYFIEVTTDNDKVSRLPLVKQ